MRLSLFVRFVVFTFAEIYRVYVLVITTVEGKK